MWFRQLQLFRFVTPLPFSVDDFNAALQKQALTACPKTSLFSQGWCNPFGEDNHDVMVHAASGYWLFCAGREERLLPASVIRDTLNEKVKQIEMRDDRQVYRKEKLRLKDEVILDLLPRSFIRRQKIFLYIDPTLQLLIVDCASRSKTEIILNLLRDTLGRLALIPLEFKQSPTSLMTTWLKNQYCSDEITLDDNCAMVDTKSGANKIKCSECNLSDKDIIDHLKDSQQVIHLGLNWTDKISFTLKDDFSLTRLRYLDLLRDQQDEAVIEDKKQQLDASFTLMVLENTAMLQALFKACGGLKEIGTATAPTANTHGTQSADNSFKNVETSEVEMA